MNIIVQAHKPDESADSGGEPQDAAAMAFELLRGEVALLRRALEGLAAEQAAIEIPDYSKTLNRMADALNTMSGQLDDLSKKPALALTPEQWTDQIATAGDKVRRTEKHTLEQAQAGFDKVSQELAARVASARKADQQDNWLMWAGVGGMLLGIALALSIFLIVNRIGGASDPSPVAVTSPPLVQGSTRTVARGPLPVGETGCASGAGAFAGNRLQGAKRPKPGGRHSEAR